MNKFSLVRLVHSISVKLTLRQKLIYLTLGAVVFLGLLLVLFINLVAPLFSVQGIAVPDTIVQVTSVNPQGTQVVTTFETPGPKGYLIHPRSQIIFLDPLDAVKYLSIVGIIIITLIAIVVSKWIARTTLAPVVLISSVAQNIGASNLNRRINYGGAKDELKVLADTFDLMLERLEDNFVKQSEYTSNLAHELRTPLTSLRMNLEVLNSDPQATLEDYQEFAGSAERALSRLERLVSDLLLLAKAEKEVDLRRITLGVVFEDIFEELKPIADQQNITLKLVGDPELEIMGDPILIHRAFSNLVENGIHYNNQGGVVEVKMYGRDGLVTIEVSDNGIGISNEQQRHIFERFYRAGDLKTRHSDGKGLGLAITAHIIQLHGGKIEVESIPQKGSIFRVNFRQFNQNSQSEK
jgi:heavy metal sensor kinase